MSLGDGFYLDEREIIAHLNEAYWLINDDVDEMKEADKEIVMDTTKARELIGEVLDFLEVHKGKILWLDNVTTDIKFAVSQLEDVASKFEHSKMIVID